MNSTIHNRFPFPAEQLLTPCLKVCPETLRDNLSSMIRIAGSAAGLRPHVKTHKCPHIVGLAASMGIVKHKCATLAEAEMLAGVASDVLLAYPLLGPAVSKFAELASHFTKCRWATVVDDPAAMLQLDQEFSRRNLQVEVYLDIDIGMHRTGIAPGDQAVELAKRVHNGSSLQLSGLHVYDGHHHQADRQQRTDAVRDSIQSVVALVEQMRSQGLPVPRLVCGGTPTFPVFAQLAELWPDAVQMPEIELSPGTSVLSDYIYGRDFSDIAGIRPAATLLTRVISKPGSGLITVDLGYKAVASDPPVGKRCHFLGLKDAEEMRHSEEHLVVRTTEADRLQLGQILEVVPSHICPTVALHSSMLVVQDGMVQDDWPIVRHRLYY
jgi:D-threonine aldolase